MKNSWSDFFNVLACYFFVLACFLYGSQAFPQCWNGSCGWNSTGFNSVCANGSCARYSAYSYGNVYSRGYSYNVARTCSNASYSAPRVICQGTVQSTDRARLTTACAPCSACESCACNPCECAKETTEVTVTGNACEPVGACEPIGACEPVETKETTEPIPACGACSNVLTGTPESCSDCSVALRRSGSNVLTGTSTVAFQCANGTCPIRTTARNVAQTLGATYLTAVNAVRAAAGLRPLTLDVNLEVGSQNHAVSMSHYGGLYHAGGVAEICAMNYSSGISGALTQWQNSSGHRALLLNPNYTRAGVGVYRDASGRNWCVMRFN